MSHGRVGWRERTKTRGVLAVLTLACEPAEDGGALQCHVLDFEIRCCGVKTRFHSERFSLSQPGYEFFALNNFFGPAGYMLKCMLIICHLKAIPIPKYLA